MRAFLHGEHGFAIKTGFFPTEGGLFPTETGLTVTICPVIPTKARLIAEFPLTIPTKGGFSVTIFAAVPTGLVVIHIRHC